MAARGETRDRVLRTAQDLMRRQGYHATGLNQVLAEAGAPKGSLYFHFPGGKEQLAAEAVGLAATELGEAISMVLTAGDSARAALRAMVTLLAASLEESNFRDGCPIATVALDAAAESEPVREACVRGYQGWTAAIAGWLSARGADARVSEELAGTVLAGIEGALLLARVGRDTAPLLRSAEHLADLLEYKCGEAVLGRAPEGGTE